MENVKTARYAVFAIGPGGEIFEERSFDEAGCALPELNRLAVSCRGAERVLIVDLRDGRRIAEREGPAG